MCFDFLGVDVEDFFVERDGLGGKAVQGQHIARPSVCVNRLRLGILFEAQVADGVVNIGVIRRFLEEFLPFRDGLVELALCHELLGFFYDRVFVNGHSCRHVRNKVADGSSIVLPLVAMLISLAASGGIRLPKIQDNDSNYNRYKSLLEA